MKYFVFSLHTNIHEGRDGVKGARKEYFKFFKIGELIISLS